jgi:hypothetical protein
MKPAYQAPRGSCKGASGIRHENKDGGGLRSGHDRGESQRATLDLQLLVPLRQSVNILSASNEGSPADIMLPYVVRQNRLAQNVRSASGFLDAPVVTAEARRECVRLAPCGRTVGMGGVEPQQQSPSEPDAAYPGGGIQLARYESL